MVVSVSCTVDVYRTVVRLWKKYPVILAPFCLIGISYAAVLALLFLAPRYPVSLILAPFIRAFWGEQFLQYPLRFLLIPQLFNYGKVIVDLLCSIVCTATAVAMVQQAYRNMRPGWTDGLQAGTRRYGRVALVWAAMFLAAIAAVRIAGIWVYPLSAGAAPLAFLAGVAAQMLFMFAIPAVVIEDRKAWSAIRRSFSLCRKLPFESLFFVFLPHVLFIPVVYAVLRFAGLLDSPVPESTVYVLLLRILLVVALHMLVVSAAAILLLRQREREYAEAAL